LYINKLPKYTKFTIVLYTKDVKPKVHELEILFAEFFAQLKPVSVGGKKLKIFLVWV
jgi:hypothetical protein